MATTITEECIACGACESECPNDAIHLGEAIFVIDPDLCSECVGSHDTQMCAEACPVDCCVADLLARMMMIPNPRQMVPS